MWNEVKARSLNRESIPGTEPSSACQFSTKQSNYSRVLCAGEWKRIPATRLSKYQRRKLLFSGCFEVCQEFYYRCDDGDDGFWGDGVANCHRNHSQTISQLLYKRCLNCFCHNNNGPEQQALRQANWLLGQVLIFDYVSIENTQTH